MMVGTVVLKEATISFPPDSIPISFATEMTLQEMSFELQEPYY